MDLVKTIYKAIANVDGCNHSIILNGDDITYKEFEILLKAGKEHSVEIANIFDLNIEVECYGRSPIEGVLKVKEGVVTWDRCVITGCYKYIFLDNF